jgi:hypothetical protein
VFTCHCITSDRSITVEVVVMMMMMMVNFTTFVFAILLDIREVKFQISARKSSIVNRVCSRILQSLPVKIVVVYQLRPSSLPPIVKFKVKVTLQLTVSQSVNLGVELHLGPMIRYLLLFDNYGLVIVGRPL